jgi:hypothetical protein
MSKRFKNLREMGDYFFNEWGGLKNDNFDIMKSNQDQIELTREEWDWYVVQMLIGGQDVDTDGFNHRGVFFKGVPIILKDDNG